MSGALCLSCGEIKISAWVICPKCDFEPVDVEDRSRHFLVAEGCSDPDEMERFRQAILAGEDLELDEAALVELNVELEEHSWIGTAVFALLLGILPLGVIGGLLLLLAWLLTRL
jgi:hypothetical protein